MTIFQLTRKEPLDYSVFSATGAALLLATRAPGPNRFPAGAIQEKDR